MRKRLLTFACAFSILASACSASLTPTSPAPTPTVTIAKVVFPTAPPGWTIQQNGSIRLSLPETWAQIPLEESKLKREVDAAAADNPHLADNLQGILTSGQFKSFLFYAADKSSTNIVKNVSIARTSVPNGTSPEEAEKDYADGLPSILKGAKLVAFETAIQVNGRKAGEVDYDLPLVNAAGQVVILRGVQYIYFFDSGDTYVVTVTGDATEQETLVPLARQIARSFTLASP